MPAPDAAPPPLTGDLAGMRWPQPLRGQQVAALAALDAQWAAGARRGLVVLPPGAGKTLVGLEAARRLGRRTVVLGPNTAIQGQWVAQWEAFVPPTVAAGVERDLRHGLTALTYQALASFEPDDEVDEEGHDHALGDEADEAEEGPLLDRLHANGRALVDAMVAAGPLTLVLDECHHLLEVWGRLLAELLGLLPDCHVVALTATPPGALTAEQARLTGELFGAPLYVASVPAVVRDGHLAPFAELAWLTLPSEHEAQWLGEQAQRFTELTTDLLDPGFASRPFLAHLDARLVRRSGEDGATVSWARLEKDEPVLARAALRLHHAGLLALPEGARVREEHRQRPGADDWVALIDDYVTSFLGRSDDPGDEAALGRLRTALPSVGYLLTRRGVRAGRSPVDRVLARSEAKTRAVVEIAAAEAAALGSRARILVVADHEQATATLPATLVGVLAEEAGSARLALDQLVADPRTAALDPVLVTGRRVAADATTARDLVAFARAQDGALALDDVPRDAVGVVDVTGRWSPRTWVRVVTAYVESGRCQALVGTRGLLGEGWDARGINVLIDLTTSTTATSVVQTRGRALRVDPGWPEKVADNWSVVCVAPEHPKGDADWARFVRKHAGYLAADASGDVVDGVTHVDADFSPFAPPAADRFDAVNAAMLQAAGSRPAVRERWHVGTPYRDVLVPTVRVVGARPRVPARLPGAERPVEPLLLPAAHGAEPRPGCPDPRALAGWELVPAGAAGVVGGVVGGVPGGAGGALAVGLVGVAGGWWAARRRAAATAAGRLLAGLDGGPDLLDFAYAVADGLRAAGLSPAGAEAVAAHVDPAGAYRVSLHDVDRPAAQTFAAALDEVLSPVAAPRYVVPRYLVAPRAPGPRGERAAGRAWLHGRAPANAVVYHAVPGVLAGNAGLAVAFAGAWSTWVSPATPLYTGSPEGEGVLVTHRGASPLDVHTALRVAWE